MKSFLLIAVFFAVVSCDYTYSCPEGFTFAGSNYPNGYGVCTVAPTIPQNRTLTPFCGDLVKGQYIGYSYEIDGTSETTQYECDKHATQVKVAPNGFGIGYCLYEGLQYPPTKYLKGAVWDYCYFLPTHNYLGFGFTWTESKVVIN